MINKRLINTGEAVVPFDPIQNFETVTYTGNGGTQKITGYIRKGGAFNGSSSKIELQTLTTGLSGSSPRSVSFWLNISALPSTAVSTMYSSGTNANGQSFQVSITTTGALSVSYYNRNINTTTTLSTNTWYHIVVSYKGGDVSTFSNTEIYINGNIQSLTDGGGGFTGTANIPDANHSLGYAKLDNLYYLNGKIDQVRIFDKVLSSSEVTTLYGETYASSTKSTTDFFGDGSGVALYELDEDANDTGTGAIDSGQSAVFNGSSSYISTPVLSLANNSFTVSTWVNRNNLGYGLIFAQGNSSDNNPVISFGFGSTNQLELLNRSAPGVGLDVYISDSVHNVTSANTWYHLLWSCTSNQSNFYVNGVLKHSASFTANSPTYNTQYIGVRKRVSFEGYFNGKIDQVRIYSSASSSSDVTNLYNETNVPTANLLAHYKLDGDATDETTNYDGTATSITYSDPAEFPPYNGTPTNVNFLGMAFQPDLVWIKRRNAVDLHVLTDSIRGTDKQLFTNQTDVESGGNTRLTSFDSNGFTLSGLGTRVNDSGGTYVSWCWKAGGTAVSNTDGTITSQVSANVDAGFSIVTYEGNVTDGATVGHGLSQPPEMIIVKGRDTTYGWLVYHADLGNTKYLVLNTTSSETVGSTAWNNTSPTSNVFTIGSGVAVNQNSMISYCFHSVAGYQKVGSYTGTGASGNTITTGFQPRFLMTKRTSASGSSWAMFDNTRGVGEPSKVLYANISDSEYSDNLNDVQFISNGFTLLDNNEHSNYASNTYIYLAIA